MMIFKKIVFFITILMSTIAFAQSREVLLQQISAQKDDTLKVGLYKKLHKIYIDFDYDRAYTTLQEMTALSKKLKYPKGLEEAHQLKGMWFYYTNKSDSALIYFHKELQFKSIKASKDKKAKVYNKLGLAFQQKQQFDSSFFYLNKAFSIFKESKEDVTLCAILNNLGLTVYSMGNANKSIAYFEQAYACMLEHNDQENLPSIINNLASLYAISGKKNPEAMLLKLLNNPEIKSNDNVKATVYLNLGSFYFRNNDPTHAERYFLKSDSLFQKISKTSSPEILHSLGSIAAKKGDNTKAISYFNRVKDDFPNYNQSKLLNHDLANAYFALKQYDKAKAYYEELLTQNDIDNKAAIEKALTKAEENLNFIKKESEIKELKLEKELLQSDKVRVRIIIVFLVIALVLLLLLGFIYLRKERQKQKINQLLLEQKNQKIKEFHQKIEQRNTVILEIESKFEEYKGQEQLKTDIIDTLDIHGDGELFNYYFDDQHKGFYLSLKNIAPDLTNNDLRLCSLTKLRLSLKETANILNLSVDAVKSGRYRIKKKLNLSQEESLSDYLNKL